MEPVHYDIAADERRIHGADLATIAGLFEQVSPALGMAISRNTRVFFVTLSLRGPGLPPPLARRVPSLSCPCGCAWIDQPICPSVPAIVHLPLKARVSAIWLADEPLQFHHFRLQHHSG